MKICSNKNCGIIILAFMSLIMMNLPLEATQIIAFSPMYFDGLAQATSQGVAGNWATQPEAIGRLDVSLNFVSQKDWAFKYSLLTQAGGYCSVDIDKITSANNGQNLVEVKMLDKKTFRVRWVDFGMTLTEDPRMKKIMSYDPRFGNTFEITLVKVKDIGIEQWQATGTLEHREQNWSISTNIDSEPNQPLIHLDCDYEGTNN